ncbi:MAG: hypothetical protein GX963_10220 [Bacteroidales bacterium]|nr:hypothetical protein [Bacteroidales bacterium]
MSAEVNEKWLNEKGYELLTFDKNWIVAFRKDNGFVQIFMKDLMNKDSENQTFTLLNDEIATINKAVCG